MRMNIVALLMVAMSACPAWGAPWDARRPGTEPHRGQYRADEPARHDPRQDRRTERDDHRRSSAMSDEERRALHRDLDRANRELYRRR